ncbi:MAG: hypothetical protein GDA55_01415 [Cellvibrionales bacterium]|nr:hypothetical protein [Cellvibrionales bacterium]
MSLIPSRQLAFCVELAATLGLEEAVLLQALSDERDAGDEGGEGRAGAVAEGESGYRWHSLSAARLERTLPFWGAADIQRIAENLRQQGVLLIGSAPLSEDGELRFAFNTGAYNAGAHNTEAESPPAGAVAAPAPEGRGTLIPTNWQPDDVCARLLAQQGVPAHFLDEQVGEFVLYWHERGEAKHSWSSLFNKWVMRKWREYEERKNAAASSLFDKPAWDAGCVKVEAVPMTRGWFPSDETMEVLITRSGIKNEFIEGCVAEFIIFWMDNGEASKTWNSKFIQHVKDQWDILQHNKNRDLKPTAMHSDWQPSGDCYRVLELAKIDLEFADNLVPEFVMHWKERDELRRGWNKLFLNMVKEKWKNQNLKSTRETSLAEDLTDLSWMH